MTGAIAAPILGVAGASPVPMGIVVAALSTAAFAARFTLGNNRV